jgi:hypothetical protein
MPCDVASGQPIEQKVVVMVEHCGDAVLPEFMNSRGVVACSGYSRHQTER